MKMKLKGTLPPHPLDLAYWTLRGKFDKKYFVEDVLKWVKANHPFKNKKN